MTDTKYDFDVTRATAIINVAMQHSMFPQGAMPESDTDKLLEAEKLVTYANQAMEVAKTVGQHNLPAYKAAEGILFEAQVLVGANVDANGSETPSAPSASSAQPAAPLEEPSPPAPTAPTGATPPESSPMPSSDSPASQPSPISPPDAGGILEEPKAGERWADSSDHPWDVLLDRGQQLQIRSAVNGLATLAPIGFLKRKIGLTAELSPEPASAPEQSAFLPTPDQLRAAGVGATPQQEQPSPSSEQSSPSSPSPSSGSPQSSSTTLDASTSSPTPAGLTGSSTPAASPSSPSPSSEQPSAPPEARDDQGDPEYARIIERVEADWAPDHMPAPQDLERPPTLGALADPTEDEALNRVLHSQYNALAARARYLFGVENALAKDCGRVRKRYMKGAVRAARQELGKQATATEVVGLAEENEDVACWTAFQERHADRADAYKAFLEIYLDNVKTLSRDLTFAGAEERGS